MFSICSLFINLCVQIYPCKSSIPSYNNYVNQYNKWYSIRNCKYNYRFELQYSSNSCKSSNLRKSISDFATFNFTNQTLVIGKENAVCNVKTDRTKIGHIAQIILIQVLKSKQTNKRLLLLSEFMTAFSKTQAYAFYVIWSRLAIIFISCYHSLNLPSTTRQIWRGISRGATFDYCPNICSSN